MLFGLIKDRFHTACLQAKYQRLVQERVLELVEQSEPTPVAEDPGQWKLLGHSGEQLAVTGSRYSRDEVRTFVARNPHARNILRLLEVYVVGPGLSLSHSSSECNGTISNEIRNLASEADRLWRAFLIANKNHFSYREYARRVWRDGECFLRLFHTGTWPPQTRFIDPEMIAETAAEAGSQGIVTEPHDVETPIAYLLVDPVQGALLEKLPPDDVLHTKIGVDANMKRGISFFMPLLEPLNSFQQWMETELKARKLQSSIVLWRKVNGSPTAADNLVGQQQTSAGTPSSDGTRQERFRSGSIITTSQGTDIKFLQPNTNFDDAASLGRLLLLCTAAGAGLPEFMLTSDASNANYASTLVAEGPAVKLFAAEQDFFIGEFNQLWRSVMQRAMSSGLLPAEFFEKIEPRWSTPNLVIRDRPKERLADVQLVDAQILSRAEVARRDGVEPNRMRHEITDEAESV